MPTAFVTGGSGFVGGALIERLRREGWDVRALARSERAAERVRELGAEPVMGDLETRPPRSRAARSPSTPPRRSRTGAIPPTSSGSTCRARENVIDACRAGGRAAARARGHRGGADGRAAARERRRERAAPAGLAVAVPVVEGEGRAARARGERRRPRDGRGAAALRLGPRRHELLPAIVEMVRVRPLPLGRRRPPPDRHDPHRQHRRGPLAGRRRAAPRAASSSSPTASRSCSASS